ncbi:MAG TPA: hypothetical protein VFQ00_14345 [Terriglobales bacterium]|nr:hypothetical protein [Terriglobales bacterium]
MFTRRQFNFRAAAITLAAPFLKFSGGGSSDRASDSVSELSAGDYTPFGYLDNPFHSWALNRSGVLRSVRGIGFALHFPAGPGGYFDEAKNGIYTACLRLGFLVGERRLWELEDFQKAELSSPYHSKNVLAYRITTPELHVTCSFVQVSGNAIGARIEVHRNAASAPARLLVAHEYRLGNAQWWGGDGIVGSYERASDTIVTRSFAAGTVFAISANYKSSSHVLGSGPDVIERWLASHGVTESAISYGTAPLQATLVYDLPVSGSVLSIVMARGANQAAAVRELSSAHESIATAISEKKAEDASFWSASPRLQGDWPQHWQNGWVYDYETLRMMVRRPIGAYRHRWDAMQIQAPRNVLAETSIDMWALSHADPETAKEVFLGQFLDAKSANIPCMREDAVMNMVAGDGSECGTSISWCYPFFCARSIHARSDDQQWLGRVYPRLAKLLRWTLANRTDKDGFVVGKCSWETGMDGSRRFLIDQPTGAETIEFIRVVELQAAAAQAAAILQQFATELGDTRSAAEWQAIHQCYLEKTNALWNGKDWYEDFDTRSGRPITTVGRDMGQVAPMFCGLASSEQMHAMMPTLRAFYEHSHSGNATVPSAVAGSDSTQAASWFDGLQWSSLTLPYLESLGAADEYELLSQTIDMIAERIYPSMDRRTVAKTNGSWIVPREGEARVGLPGVSCEMWTPHGAGGGEGYGWGAVLPVHILRSLIGFREADKPLTVWLCPNLPQRFMIVGRNYGVRNVTYRGTKIHLAYEVSPENVLKAEIQTDGPLLIREIREKDGEQVPIVVSQNGTRASVRNGRCYRLQLAASA